MQDNTRFDTPTISVLVEGSNGLFSDPVTKVGGEKLTYSIPTYDGLRGIMDSIYWKPTFHWVIERVRVMNRINMETKGLLLPRICPGDKPGDKTQSFCTYLYDVAYQIQAHMEWDRDKPEYEKDRKADKHFTIAMESLKAGGRRDIFIGKREGCCFGYASPCVFGEGDGYYDHSGAIQFGMMLHGVTYPTDDDPYMKTRYWIPTMENGIVEFPHPNECDPMLTRIVKRVDHYKVYHKVKEV